MVLSNCSSVTLPEASAASLERRSVGDRRLGDVGGVLVADHGAQRGDQHQAAVHVTRRSARGSSSVPSTE